MTARVALFVVAGIMGLVNPSLAADPGSEDPDNAWRTKDKDGNAAPIAVSITAPTAAARTGSPLAHYVPINHTFALTASASDTDSYCKPTDKGGDGQWYNYGDDVTSGTDAADHHLWWTVTSGDGSFPEVSRYGVSGTYVAPDYHAGSALRTAKVQARAQDYQRTGDNLGDDADSQGNSAEFTLKVWQVTVTVHQNGQKSANNDATTAPATHGGADLGWVVPGAPAGAEGYHGNTEVKGTIPAGPGVTTGYAWINEKKGFTRIKVNGGAWNKIADHPAWTDDSPYAMYQDQDSRHGGNDVREIFMVDAPGFIAGATNDNRIGAPDNWTDLERDMDYKSHVNLGGTRVSNEAVWPVDMVLDVVGGKWHVVSHTP